MKTLVISFTGALYALKSGRLTPESLDTALFYFGCVREHALNPADEEGANEVEWLSDDQDANRRIHKQLVDAVMKAEKEGRVAWRPGVKQSNSYMDLNALLTKNGYQQLDFTRYDSPWYNYPTVEEAAQDQGLPLEVVWRS